MDTELGAYLSCRASRAETLLLRYTQSAGHYVVRRWLQALRPMVVRIEERHGLQTQIQGRQPAPLSSSIFFCPVFIFDPFELRFVYWTSSKNASESCLETRSRIC